MEAEAIVEEGLFLWWRYTGGTKICHSWRERDRHRSPAIRFVDKEPLSATITATAAGYTP